ncbi:MAG: endonuclease/exonuclease/phosphatase family metal-dependent hydrolase [Candidatus Azotimanducaceae bacterium]|jgi:endonuclease/exonuclease/phosphatase family metal-dependent hydrolase
MTARNIILGFTFCVALLLLGSAHFPVTDKAGSSLLLPDDVVLQVADRESFRIDNFNVQRGKGDDDVRDLSRAASVLQGADIAAIQEVSGTLFYGWQNQAIQLAEALQMGYLFAPTSWKWFQPYAGSALLSKFSLSSWTIEELPATEGDNGHRNLITAIVDIQGRPVTLLVTHLDRRESNAIQLDYVFERFAASLGPTILLGDLNTDLSNNAIQQMLARPDVRDAIHESIGQFWRLDWIITRGFDVVQGGHTPRGISDHAHYWVELAFTDSATHSDEGAAVAE